MKRRVFLALGLLFLFAVVYVAWTLARLPPVKYYVRYGLDPYCAPTGGRVTCEGVEFVEIGPGIFKMGSTHLAEGGDWLGKLCRPFGLPWGKRPTPSDEMPVHWVEFRRGFWIATTEITNAQYERFRPKNARNESSKGDDTPVVDVSWQDAKEYCAWLSKESERPIRLPSEAEWECACRGGSDDELTCGDDEERLSEYAWFDENSEGRAHDVGTKRPNRWGLHDLHGNVWEWCEDTYYRSYEDGPMDGSPRTEGGMEFKDTHYRALRGGDWRSATRGCRSAFRSWCHASGKHRYPGFRPAFVPPKD